MADLNLAMSMCPGTPKLNLHACYAIFDEENGGWVDRDKLAPKHFKMWVDFCKKHGLDCDFNPTFVSYPKCAPLTLAFSNEEIDRVKREIPGLAHPEIRLYFALLAYTGMRREEIMGLHWEDVDLKDAIAYVCCTVTYPQRNHPVIQYSAKSECSIRPVLLPSALVQLMKPLARQSGFLFGGERPWCYSTMTRRAKQGRELLNVKEFNNHDWRTTYGSQLKESGMTSAQVADLMGHADTRMVETVYARRRTSGVMKQKSVLDELNSAYVV